MRTILLITTLLFSINAMAETPDFIGGTVKNGDSVMGFECAVYDNDNKCEEMDLKVNHGNGFFTQTTLTRVDVNATGREARREAGSDLNEDYTGAASIGFAVGFVTIWATKGSPLALPVLVVGTAFDIVKAPVVGAAWLLHKITDIGAKRRFKNLLEHMMDSEKKGKTKHTRKRYFRALQYSISR